MRSVTSVGVALLALSLWANAVVCSPKIRITPGQSVAAPSPSTKEGLRVVDVQIDGNQLISKEDILAVIKTKPGDKFDRDKVSEDLKAIRAMGHFDNRSLTVVPELKDGGVLLKFHVQEIPPADKQVSNEPEEPVSKPLNEQLLGSPNGVIQKVRRSINSKAISLGPRSVIVDPKTKKDNHNMAKQLFVSAIRKQCQKDLDGAIADYLAAINFEDEDPSIHWYLGTAYQAAGRAAEAIQELEKEKNMRARDE